MKLNIRKYYSVPDEAETLMKEIPATKAFYEMLQNELGCELKDIVTLDVFPSWAAIDEEGWDVKSFFPPHYIPSCKVLHENYCVDGFTFGGIERVVTGGVTFIAQYNASPVGLFANRNKIESL